MDRTERITKLLANKQLDEKDRTTLEEMSDEQLALFEKQVTANEAPDDGKDDTSEEAKSAESAEAKQTDAADEDDAAAAEDADAKAPATNQEPEHVVYGRKLFEAKKAKLIEQISANARNSFDAQELEAMPYETLEKMGKLSIQPTFAGRLLHNEGDEEPADNAAGAVLPLPGFGKAQK